MRRVELETAQLTMIESRRPAVLSKSVRRGPKGELIRDAGGLLVEGRTRVASVASLADLAALLQNLGSAQALAFGVPRGGERTILSRAALARRGPTDGVTTRTRDCFKWPGGAGILMLDHDPGDVRLTREDLVELLRKIAPGLADAAMLWWPSASSHICDAESGEDLTGLQGQRIYLMVREAADIPRAGAALVDRLWATGHGRIAVSAAGAALERCPVDASVWQPERLDFAAGAVCGEGLVQRRGEPVLISGIIELVDTRVALPDDPEVQEAAAIVRKKAKANAAPAVESARQAFLDRQSAAMLAPGDRDDAEKREAARVVLVRALENSVLSGDFPVELETGPGRFETTTVGNILDDPAAYHGRLTRDPLEPGYDGGRAVGKLFLLDSRPTLFSFAHHGHSFRLVRSPRRIEVPQGRLVVATEATLDVLRDDPAIFDFGGQVALVDGGRLHPLDEHALGFHLAGDIQFWKYRKVAGELEEMDIDPPAKLVRQVISLGPKRRLKELSAVVTAPTIRPDGSVLASPGYDAETSLLVVLQDAVELTAAPGGIEVREALSRLMQPFEDFPLVDGLARSGLLAALLTAVVRPTLTTAPAFAMDAPVQGSGKTLLASCVAALATGHMPDIWPHTAGRDDEEIRKRLFTALRDGTTALIWDNVTGILDSAALASAITAPVLRDRVLGRSESLSIPNRAMLLLTGNNICPAGDLPRRIIPIRIDPGTDTPFARQFDLDPLDHVLEHRIALACAALVLIRGWLSSGAAPAKGRMASFETWDDLVRQTVCWINAEIAPGEFGDPLDLVRQAQSSDPEQESLFALLEALDIIFARSWFTASEVRRRASRGREELHAGQAEKTLGDALADIGGERSLTSTKSVGRNLKYREGRIAYGLRLRCRPTRNGLEYRIDAVNEPDRRGFGALNGFESVHSEMGSENDWAESERRKTNPPNRANPQDVASDASEGR